jgi:NADH-quinone oxidoreductase subunit J
MTAMQVLFLFMAGVTLFGAVMTVTAHRMLHAAMWLILSLMGVGASYVLLEASFFAVVQILVYVGAIAILILFAIMLTRKSMIDTGSQTNKGWIPVMLVVLIACAGIILAILTWPAAQATASALPVDEKNITTLGEALVSPQGFVIPFEATSILLLAALVGAIYTSVERKEDK